MRNVYVVLAALLWLLAIDGLFDANLFDGLPVIVGNVVDALPLAVTGLLAFAMGRCGGSGAACGSDNSCDS